MLLTEVMVLVDLLVNQSFRCLALDSHLTCVLERSGSHMSFYGNW